jgi:chromosome segregation ATPase
MTDEAKRERAEAAEDSDKEIRNLQWCLQHERDVQQEAIDGIAQHVRERDEARNEVERLEREHMNCGGAIVVLQRERDEARARVVELEDALTVDRLSQISRGP